MKIIFAVDYISRLNTGISTLIENLSKEFVKEGHTIYIACLKDRYTEMDSANFTNTTLYIIDEKPGVKNFVSLFKKYYRFYAESDADIAHLHSFWSVSTLAAFFWARRYKKKYIISANGMFNAWALSQSKAKKKLFLFLIYRKIIQKASSVIVNSELEKQYLTSLRWNSIFHIIPNGVNLPETVTDIPKGGNKHKLLFLSRIHKKKGIDLLLDVWEDIYLETTKKGWELQVVGFSDNDDTGFENIIYHRIKSTIGLTNVSTSSGLFGDAMWQCYQSSDAFILPTFSEGSAMVVLNAWATGKISITTKGSNLEFGLNERCTILIEPTRESIKKGILQLMNLSDTDIYAFGQIGKQVVQDNYSWEKIADRHLDLYLN